MNKYQEIFLTFLRLGVSAFGGPVAHLGYFRAEFVAKKKWITDPAYADLVALCQFLPGPASSQVGFTIGIKKGGILGGFLAWLGFTAPSAALMMLFAYGLKDIGNEGASGEVAGLKLAAVAVVAEAIWKMALSLCPDRPRATIAVLSAIVLLLFHIAALQIGIILAGAIVGWCFLKEDLLPEAEACRSGPQNQYGWLWLVVFVLLLLGLPVLAHYTQNHTLSLINGFYRTGSLVFGGGHVVLPLLENFTVSEGLMDKDFFLAGYGAAQAVPGPLFTFAAYLGSSIYSGPGGFRGGFLALFFVFLPSWLLVMGLLPYWERLRGSTDIRRALRGANAAVVGLLLAAFYNPIWTAAILDEKHLAVALLGFLLLVFWKLPTWIIVISCGMLGQLFLG